MRTVIERIFHDDDRMEDKPSSYEAAEKLAGVRLDRRKSYAIIRGAVHESAVWTQECSGCSCDCGGGYPCGHGAGGCRECGYTGKRRNGMWVPLVETDE